MIENPSFHQIPFQIVSDRLKDSSKLISDLFHSTKARFDVMDVDIRSCDMIARMNIYENEISNTSSEKSLGMMKNYYLFLSKELFSLRKSYEEPLLKDMETYKLARTKIASQYKTLCENAIAEVETSYSKLDLAKSTAGRIKTSLDEAKEKLDALDQAALDLSRCSEDHKRDREKEQEKNIMGRMLFGAFQTTPEQEREKQSKRCHKFHCELLAATEELAIKRRDLLRKIEIRDDTLDKAASEFQVCEKERLERVKLHMKRLCEFEKKNIEIRNNLITTFEEAVMKVDTEKDLEDFIEISKYPDQTHKYHKVLEFLDWNYANKNLIKSTDVLDSPLSSLNRTSNTPSDKERVVESSDQPGHIHIDTNSDAYLHLSRANDAINAADEYLFTEGTPPDESPDDDFPLVVCKETFNESVHREYFLRKLDFRRSRSAAMWPRRFHRLVEIMKEFLDACETTEDISAVLRAGNMANTFHESSSSDNKLYIMHHPSFKTHSVWRLDNFWSKALTSAIQAQLSLQDGIRWDDLEQYALVDIVTNTHNLIFGQLGSLAFTMHELGLEFEEVIYKCRELSQNFELSEDQSFQLLQSVKITFTGSKSVGDALPSSTFLKESLSLENEMT